MRCLSPSSRKCARSALSIDRARRSGRTDARVDGARVIVGAGIRLAPAEDPFDGGVQAVEIDVRDQRVDRTGVAHDLGRHHLGARAVLGLGGEHEAGVAGEVDVALVIVMIDPCGEPAAEVANELARGLVEGSAHAIGGEGDVDDRDTAAELARVGQIARRREHNLGQRRRA